MLQALVHHTFEEGRDATGLIKWLRGDTLNQTMDIYNRIDEGDVKESYLRCVPRLMTSL